MEKKYLAEIIGKEYEEWMCGDLIFITTPTGTGKTTFILRKYLVWAIKEGVKSKTQDMNALYGYSNPYSNKKSMKGIKKGCEALFLVPRTILKDQLKREMKEVLADNFEVYDEILSNIYIWTYQELEEKLRWDNFIPNFYIIICDEAHYFLNDSTFNALTQISYDYIVEKCNRGESMLIVMSATIERIKEHLQRDIKDRNPKIKGRVYIGRGYLYEYSAEMNYDDINIRYIFENNYEELDDLIPYLPEKTIYFVNSKSEGEKIQQGLKQKGISVAFVTADNKMNTAISTVNSLAHNQMFREDVLIVTSVLDVGVSIHDKKLKNIIIDAYQKETFLQMLGRVRREEGQSLDIYIFSRDYTYFDDWIEKMVVPYTNIIEELSKYEEKELNLVVPEMKKTEDQKKVKIDSIVYADRNGLHLNKLCKYQWTKLYKQCIKIRDHLKEDPDYFVKEQLRWLRQEESFSIYNYTTEKVREIRRDMLIKKIKSEYSTVKNKILTFEELRGFLEIIKPYIREFNKDCVRSNETLSKDCFIRICDSEKLPFQIKQEKKNRQETYQLIYMEQENI